MLTAVATLVLLHGTVTIGPTAPVCRAGTPCTRRAAHVVLTFRRPGHVRRTTTDRLGRYRLRLAPGTWYVRASAGMRIAPATFVVPRAHSALRSFRIDTGIR
ncbi:MAG: carboxypeptidase-like regulatory domain-containing protein [Gaiellaceae bacterium]